MNAPIHFFGRITAVVLLVCCIAVFASSADLWNDHTTALFADTSYLPSTSNLASRASSSVFAAAQVAQTSATSADVATRPDNTATDVAQVPAQVGPIVHDLHPIQVVASASASSAALNDSLMTAPANVSDGSLATAWNVPDDGVDRAVTLMFDGPVKLREIQIATGYATMPSATVGARHAQLVRLEFTNASVEMPLRDVATLQSLKLDTIVTSFVRVVLLRTQPSPSTKAQPFTAINEIVPIGDVCAPHTCGDFAETIRAIATLRSAWGGDTIIEKVDGDYARARVHALAPSDVVTPAVVLLKRQDGAWAVVSMGQSFTPDKLRQLGVPASLVE